MTTCICCNVIRGLVTVKRWYQIRSDQHTVSSVTLAYSNACSISLKCIPTLCIQRNSPLFTTCSCIYLVKHHTCLHMWFYCVLTFTCGSTVYSPSTFTCGSTVHSPSHVALLYALVVFTYLVKYHTCLHMWLYCVLTFMWFYCTLTFTCGSTVYLLTVFVLCCVFINCCTVVCTTR
jgi:hypothetical protein